MNNFFRENIFRVWDSHQNKMIPWHFIINNERLLYEVMNYSLFPRYYKPMELTGFNDCNGNNIYELDLVRIKDLNSQIKMVGWDQERAAFRFFDVSGLSKWTPVDLDMSIKNVLDVEIVGSVYENEDVLKKYGKKFSNYQLLTIKQ